VRIKNAIVIIVGFTLFGNTIAQDFHFSQFMENMNYVNPAYVALPDAGELGLTYRNQWPGIPATFVTYGARVTIPVNVLSSGIGIHLMNDMQGSGIINRTSASLQYGYIFQASSSWQIAAGIGASYIFKKFDANDLVFRSDILNDLGYGLGTVTYDNYAKSYPDFNAGLIARNKNNLSVGFSVSHLTRPRESFSTQVGERLPMKYTAFVSGRISADKTGNPDLTIEPALYFSKQQDNNELIWGTRFLLGSNFMAGGWIRQNLQFNMEAFIVAAGISWERYNITYSYDVNLKKMHFMSIKMAAHEVTFLYSFEYKDKKSRKPVCPAYL
jgi:type IX secretion system PorP/SprF family membrane protein